MNTKKGADSNVTEEMQKLATDLGIPVQKFFEIYDQDEDCITIINPVGKFIKDKIQNLALLTLFGYRLFFGQAEVPVQEIKRNVTENKNDLFIRSEKK